eukprot:359606-Chlamydomonas_euryale.AAC.1
MPITRCAPPLRTMRPPAARTRSASSARSGLWSRVSDAASPEREITARESPAGRADTCMCV